MSLSAAFGPESWTLSGEERQEIERAGVRVLTGLYGLADGVAEGLSAAPRPARCASSARG